MILPIQRYSPDEFGLTIYKLIQLNEMVRRSPDSVITVDFGKSQFLHCMYLSGLFSLMSSWRSMGKIIDLECHGNMYSYLKAINFEDGLDLCNCANSEVELMPYRTKRYIPMAVFPTLGTQREDCINSIVSLIERQTGVKGDSQRALDYFITELTNNVADHSESKTGMIAAQTYDEFIDICISDNGIGVLSSYAKSKIYNPQNEAEAIDMAVNGKSTKKQAVSRGFGLTSSREIIMKELSGKFLMWSGSAMFIQSKTTTHVIEHSKDAFYQGCFIALRLPLDILSNADDFNFYQYMG